MKSVALVILGLIGTVSQTGCSCCCFHDWFSRPTTVAPTYCPPPAVSTTAPTYYVPPATTTTAAPAIAPIAAPAVTPTVQTQPCVYAAPVVQQQPCCVPCTCTCQ